MNSTILSEFSHQAENGSFRGTKTCHTWKSSPETKFSGYLHCSTSEPQPGLDQGIPGKLLGEKPLEHPFMGQAGGPDRRRVLPLLQNLDDKEVLCLQLFSSPPFCCKRKGSQTLPVPGSSHWITSLKPSQYNETTWRWVRPTIGKTSKGHYDRSVHIPGQKTFTMTLLNQLCLSLGT